MKTIDMRVLDSVRGGVTLGQVLGGAVGRFVDASLPIRIDAVPRTPVQGPGIPLPAHVWGAPNR